MADSNQENQIPSLARPASAQHIQDGPCAQKPFTTDCSNSASQQQQQQSNNTNAQMAFATEGNPPANNGSLMNSNTLQPPVGSPHRSRPTTPVLLPGFASADLPSTAPNQPSPPAYQSPYAKSAPFPANNTHIMAPTPIHPPNNPQTYAQPRSGGATPAPTTSGPAAQGRMSSTLGYTSYTQDLREAVTQIRSGRLSPISHVCNALSIVSDTGYTPKTMQRLAGIMAGNPMINSVKVIQRLAEGYEEVCEKLDCRDVTIRQLHASQAQMQAEHARKTQQEVNDAVRLVRPPPWPTVQQEADLKNRDEKIKALEMFVGDQTKRVVELEAARDHAQNMQLDMRKTHEKELAAAKEQTARLAEELSDAKEQTERLTEELNAAQNQARQRQDFIQSQGSSQSNGYGHHHGDAPSQGQNQIFDRTQAFSLPQAFGQGPEFDFENLFAQQSPSQEQNNGYHQSSNLTQHHQQSFNDQFDFLQQPAMPGFSQNMLLPHGMDFGQLGGVESMDNPFGMSGQEGNLFQQEMSARRARTVQESFVPQSISNQQGRQGIQNMQGQFNGQDQHNSLTPGRQQRQPSQSQQSPQRFQNMPGQGQQNAFTPNRQQRLPSQQSPPRVQNNQVQGQAQGQRNDSSPNGQQTPQPKAKRGRPTKKSQQASAQQNMNGQAAQQTGSAFQSNSQNNPQVNSNQGHRRTTQTRGPRKAAAQSLPEMLAQQPTQGYQNNDQHQEYVQGQDASQQYVPPQTRKRNAATQEDQQGAETPQGEVGKITLDALRRSVRQKYGHAEVKLDGGFKRSF
ncbi:hypothetical protein DL98DRAFT_537231 [Cadophora sp. DSE1049]|nr:hypothetical protein DL98DRAFT_537231 [Cadophora sp. DSE1049]